MNKTLTYVLLFCAGAAVGGYTTYKYIKEKYAAYAQEEIDSIKDLYSKKYGEKQDKNTGKHDDDATKIETNSIVRDFTDEDKAAYENYANKYSSSDTEKNKIKTVSDVEEYDTPSKHDPTEPYIIKPEEFAEFDSYSTVSLTYYEADKILADDDDNIIDSPEDTVGEDFVSHFGEYEDDTVFVRNDAKWCDYEILRDFRSFSEVTGVSPDSEEEE